MASSPSPSENQLIPRSEVDSQLSSLVFDLSQQVQAAMENMLKMITEIDENSAGIMEDIEKCKDNALERKRTLEEQKESFQKAAFSVLDMLNKKDIGYRSCWNKDKQSVYSGRRDEVGSRCREMPCRY